MPQTMRFGPGTDRDETVIEQNARDYDEADQEIVGRDRADGSLWVTVLWGPEMNSIERIYQN